MKPNTKQLPGAFMAALCCLCLWCSAWLQAQPKATQSHPPYPAGFSSLLQPDQQQENFSPDSISYYLRKAAGLAKKAKKPTELAEAYTIAGALHIQNNNFDSAAYFMQQALTIYKKTGNEEKTAQLYVRLSVIELAQGTPEIALQLLLKALALQEKNKDSVAIARTYMSVGDFYLRQEQSEMALSYFSLARQMFRQNGTEADKIKLAGYLGTVYYQLGRQKEAAENLETALAYYKQTGNLPQIANIYTNLAAVKLSMKQVPQAIDLHKKSLAIQSELNNKPGQVAALNNLAVVYLQTQAYDQAIEYFNQAMQIAHEVNSPILQRDVAGNLYYAHKTKGELGKSLQYLEQYSDLQDSLFNTTRSQQIAELQQKYEADKREKEIALLKKEQELQETHVGRRTLERNVTIAGLLLTILIAYAVVRTVRSRQQSALLLAAKNNELNSQRVKQLLKEQELISVHSMLQGQENERKRIAQDLHDRLGSLLATVKLHFQMATTPEQHHMASQLIDEACQEVRQISHNMVSGVLMKFGLVAALQDLANAVSNSGKIKMTAYSHGIDDRLPNQVEIELYRIVQELLSNTLRHAHATEITVQINRIDNELNLMVEDDGKGFDPSTAKSSDGLGLQGIKARVQMLHGELHIDSGKGSGTTVMVDVPMPETQAPLTLANANPKPKPSYDEAIAGR